MPVNPRRRPGRNPRSRSGSWELFRELLAAAPDDPRWAALSRRCERLIRGMVLWRIWVRKRIGATDSVEDVAQEVMLRLVARGRRGFTPAPDGCRESFDGYMRRIAEHLIVDEFRRLGPQGGPERRLITVDPRRFETGLREENEPDDGFFSPARPAMHRETMEIIRRTLDGMSRDPRQQRLNRHLFQLYFLDGISMAQIAKLRSVPLSASSVSRRLQAIRSTLQQVFPSPVSRRRTDSAAHLSRPRTDSAAHLSRPRTDSAAHQGQRAATRRRTRARQR